MSLRDYLIGFYVDIHSGDGAAIAEAPGMVDYYLKQHPPSFPMGHGTPEYLHQLTEKMIHNKLLTSCITCEHFDHKLEMCRLYSQRPPASVIAKGCVHWTNDGIPF